MITLRAGGIVNAELIKDLGLRLVVIATGTDISNVLILSI